jgi:endogenous inhibitor of DNA gyrase (YacG/DUF329 family)
MVKLLLNLPKSVSCPTCQTPLDYVYVQPEVSEVNGSFKGTTVSCPYCTSTNFIEVESMAQAVARKVLKDLEQV